MEVAKITGKGQITIPIGIRKKLGVKEGDKVVFIEDDGRIVVANAAKIALANIRAAFAGEAERLGLKDEQDVVALVDEVRAEMCEERQKMWEERQADND
ncbi:MAG: AbrB/MazE/SpoVT family DNA-binding domain-containing protein [Deltaproteobacteria bacterium]|jgi:AbrB family looped-hinge helix DNA binding protein|nr:AbrB/MazE/SpoVT family DNA-binding domain-containing protein [Deltaproteobacteria bacterium]